MLEIPYIFTGMPRSGTTMLGRIAEKYLGFSLVNEGPFELSLMEHVSDPTAVQDDERWAKYVEKHSQHQYFSLLLGPQYDFRSVAKWLIENTKTQTARSLAFATLAYTRDVKGQAGIGHEDPLLMNDLRSVVKLYGDCRFVHIVRDPRDCAASILRFPWGANNVAVYAARWKRDVQRALVLGEELGSERFLTVHYEELLAEPRKAIAALRQFCGLSETSDEARAFVEEMERNPLRTNSGTWKTKLSDYQIGLVERIAGPLMTKLGYVPSATRFRLRPLELMFWKAHHRSVQVKAILSGRISRNGSAIPPFKPESEAYSKDRKDQS